MSRIDEFIKIPGSKEIPYILEQYAGRPLHEMEQEFIAITVMEDSWNFDMIDEVASHVADEGVFNFVRFKYLVTQMADVILVMPKQGLSRMMQLQILMIQDSGVRL